MKNHAAETGKRLREERKARGWSQAELAARCRGIGTGLTPAAIGNYEQGTRVISREKARILEAVFGLPSAYFLGELTKEEALIIAALRSNRDSRHSKK